MAEYKTLRDRLNDLPMRRSSSGTMVLLELEKARGDLKLTYSDVVDLRDILDDLIRELEGRARSSP